MLCVRLRSAVCGDVNDGWCNPDSEKATRYLRLGVYGFVSVFTDGEPNYI